MIDCNIDIDMMPIDMYTPLRSMCSLRANYLESMMLIGRTSEVRRVVVITGAGQGLGRAYALMFGARGQVVVAITAFEAAAHCATIH